MIFQFLPVWNWQAIQQFKKYPISYINHFEKSINLLCIMNVNFIVFELKEHILFREERMTYVFSYFPISSAVFSDGVFVYMSFISYWIKCCCLVPWLGNNYSLKLSWFVRILCTNLHMETSLLFNKRLRSLYFSLK